MTYAHLDYWEYKTVHSRRNEFGSPFHLQRLVNEEARAGWTLIDRFGASSARFRRPTAARNWDHLLPRGVNPYRTQYYYTPEPESQIVNLVILAALALISVAGIIGIVLMFCWVG